MDFTASGTAKSSPALPAILLLHSLPLRRVGNGNTDWASLMDQDAHWSLLTLSLGEW